MGNEGWHKEDIKAAIWKRGMNITRLAKLHNLQPAACREALIRGNLMGEQVIASFLGVAARELWPDRYNEDGTPRRPHSRLGSATRRAERHGRSAHKCATGDAA